MSSYLIHTTLTQINWQILQGIRLIKYYAWETFYAGKVTKVRVQEMESLRIVA